MSCQAEAGHYAEQWLPATEHSDTQAYDELAELNVRLKLKLRQSRAQTMNKSIYFAIACGLALVGAGVAGTRTGTATP